MAACKVAEMRVGHHAAGTRGASTAPRPPSCRLALTFHSVRRLDVILLLVDFKIRLYFGTRSRLIFNRHETRASECRASLFPALNTPACG